MRKKTKNPKTGFLESNKLVSFDSAAKVRFLELARQMVDAGNLPSVPKLCEALGIGQKTYYVHKAQDEVFAERWEELIDLCEDRLTSVMYARGQQANGYMDRITWLRAHRPGKWNPDLRIQIAPNRIDSKTLVNEAKSYVDASIVSEIPEQISEKTPASAQQDGETD